MCFSIITLVELVEPDLIHTKFTTDSEKILLLEVFFFSFFYFKEAQNGPDKGTECTETTFVKQRNVM